MTNNQNNHPSPFLDNSPDVAVKPKNKGRQPIPLDKKRRSFLMLRLNSPEIERFYSIKKERQWTGDDASLARDLILSKRLSSGPSLDLLALEETLSALYVSLPDITGESYTQEHRTYIVEKFQAMLKDVLRNIYTTKQQAEDK